jgi:hypothetical protein
MLGISSTVVMFGAFPLISTVAGKVEGFTPLLWALVMGQLAVSGLISLAYGMVISFTSDVPSLTTFLRLHFHVCYRSFAQPRITWKHHWALSDGMFRAHCVCIIILTYNLIGSILDARCGTHHGKLTLFLLRARELMDRILDSGYSVCIRCWNIIPIT